MQQTSALRRTSEKEHIIAKALKPLDAVRGIVVKTK